MSGQDFPTDEMRYDLLTQQALRGVIRSALQRANEADGLPGAHHFFITFKTRATGVSIPADLLDRYPDEITIVIQHQYWDLVPDEAGFSIVLQFSGQPKKLVVPYAAITRFYDPSVQFVLQFEPPFITEVEEDEPDPTDEDDDGPQDDGPKVVSLDQFRKK
ncbi:MAG TPA: ClpXP protease specificity-enhancing factor SspB [Brevundimonas sp.]|jgi:hypothetical protein|uniref:SspB family protein n=1 Tax=Brevundimonas sp. TaxID=1871086 RepID=UPI002C37EF0C|nr:ClpXP protease specificity-enhancing factor SspB [Brevundimonas sp.]HRH20695.1 ClpXP protease specificity-enhancing factor SspB [Brevundimonas sp.]